MRDITQGTHATSKKKVNKSFDSNSFVKQQQNRQFKRFMRKAKRQIYKSLK